MNRKKGFTIVELVIVIVVIAILATISIVAYSAMSRNAQVSAVQSALTQANKKLGVYLAENDTYPVDQAAFNTLLGAGSSATTYQYSVNNTSNPKTYCITATNGTVSYKAESNATNPVSGGCAGHGVGGVAAITNIAINPNGQVDWNRYSSWPGNGGGNISHSIVPSAASSSNRAVRSTWTTSNTAYNGDIGYNTLSDGGAGSLQPLTQYTAIWRVSTSKSQRLMSTVGNFRQLNSGAFDGSGTIQAASPTIVTTAGQATQQYVTFTTGTNTYGVKLFTTLTSGTGASYWNAGDYMEMTDLMIVKGSVIPTYADGNSPNWVWNGTPGASTSTGPAL